MNPCTILKCISVEPVLFFYMMAIYLETNVLNELICVKSSLQFFPLGNMSNCNHSDVHDIATYWSRNNLGVLFTFTFISSFYVASWSDKFGHKLTMIIPAIGTVIASCINCCLSIYIYTDVSYLFISSTISGLTFGSLGVISSSFRYISNKCDESSRTKRIVILEAMLFVGGTVGVNIAKVFLRNKHFELTLNSFAQLFIIELCISAFIIFYIIVRFSDCNADRLPLTCHNLFTLGNVIDSLRSVFRAREEGKRKSILLLLFSLFLIYFGFTVQISLAYLYVTNLDLQWTFEKYSNFNALQLALEGIALVIFLPLMFYFIKIPDHFIAGLGILSKMIGYAVFGLSTTDAMIFTCAALYIFSEYPVPAIRSMLSKIVDADERGRIFAFTALLQNISFLIGSLSLMSVFYKTQSFFPGLSFEVAAVLQVIPLLIIIYLYFTTTRVSVNYEELENGSGPTEELVIRE